MAKRILHKLIDDLTGDDADETLRFALDDTRYEIDLSADNARKFRETLAPYVARGRRTGRNTRTARRAGGGRR
ncbi:histone-like nucleoid-structuring protein Lsr2 [Micromonospora sp. NPDC051141]|uniref:Lsr2 dimerization domain-containing protein n=1 Tax=Micromonospora sp. NPDC051141 TaxID=3364284 RepID=UPI0037A10EEA